MKNIEMFNQSYTDLVEALYDLTQSIAKSNDWDEITNELDITNSITTILKRMGETTVLENGGSPNDEIEEELKPPTEKKRGITKKEVERKNANIKTNK